MTSPLFPFETRLHREALSVHRPHHIGVTDPAVTAPESVKAWHVWHQPDSETAPTKIKVWLRNPGNTAWLFVNAWHLEQTYTDGQVPVADADGYFLPGDVEGGGSGGPATVDIQDEGVPEGAADTLDFTGSGVSVTFAAGKATVTISGGSGGGWTEVVNENGTTFANFTGVSGTWNSNGTVIRQTAISASWKGAILTAKQCVGAGYVMEADVKIVSGSSGLRAVGLLIGTGPTIPNGGPHANLRNNSGSFLANIDRHNADSPLSVAFSFSEDTFYTLRFVCTGGYGSIFVDGVLVGGGNLGHPSEASYIALMNFNCEAHYQNILGWRPLLPGE